jgi:hypothetical protein
MPANSAPRAREKPSRSVMKASPRHRKSAPMSELKRIWHAIRSAQPTYAVLPIAEESHSVLEGHAAKEGRGQERSQVGAEPGDERVVVIHDERQVGERSRVQLDALADVDGQVAWIPARCPHVVEHRGIVVVPVAETGGAARPGGVVESSLRPVQGPPRRLLGTLEVGPGVPL